MWTDIKENGRDPSKTILTHSHKLYLCYQPIESDWDEGFGLERGKKLKDHIRFKVAAWCCFPHTRRMLVHKQQFCTFFRSSLRATSCTQSAHTYCWAECKWTYCSHVVCHDTCRLLTDRLPLHISGRHCNFRYTICTQYLCTRWPCSAFKMSARVTPLVISERSMSLAGCERANYDYLWARCIGKY